MYVQSNTLFLADVFESLRTMFFEVCERDPANFLFAPGIVWQAALKMIKVKLDLLADIDVLFMVEKGN